MKVCTIRASDLAAVCGRHPYREQSAEVQRLRALLTGGYRKAQEVRAQQQLGPNTTTADVIQAAQTLSVAPVSVAVLHGSQTRLQSAKAAQTVVAEKKVQAERQVATATAAHQTAMKHMAVSYTHLTLPTI